MIDAKAQRVLGQVRDEICGILAPDLVSLVLYGSAVGSEFVAQRSDLNLAIVLSRVRPEHLQKLQKRLPDWHLQRVAVPLLIDREFLRRACDVFPMELFDMQGQHRILWGEDVIRPLRIEARHLRYQAEHEARSKLLRLRAMYAEIGADHAKLRNLLVESVKSFVLVQRSLVHLRTGEHVVGLEETVQRFEATFAQKAPSMTLLLRLKQGQVTWPSELQSLFVAYLGEVEALVAVIDQLPVELT